MDKIEKVLKRLGEKEKILVKDILERLRRKDLKTLDIKKLKGRDDIFRARRGTLRIIYHLKNETIFILAIERRNEKTYK